MSIQMTGTLAGVNLAYYWFNLCPGARAKGKTSAYLTSQSEPAMHSQARGLAVFSRSRRGWYRSLASCESRRIAMDALYAGKLRDKPHKRCLDMFIGASTGAKI